MANHLQQSTFSYTTCTDLYGSPKSDPNSALRLCVYNLYQTGRSRRTLYNRCTTPRPLTDVPQAIANNLQQMAFCTPPVPICTSPQSRTRTAHLGCVSTSCTELGGPVAPCTTGVRLPDRSLMFIRPWRTICSERHFRTPAVRICMAPRNQTRTAQLSCVCVQSTPNLEDP